MLTPEALAVAFAVSVICVGESTDRMRADAGMPDPVINLSSSVPMAKVAVSEVTIGEPSVVTASAKAMVVPLAVLPNDG